MIIRKDDLVSTLSLGFVQRRVGGFHDSGHASRIGEAGVNGPDADGHRDLLTIDHERLIGHRSSNSLAKRLGGHDIRSRQHDHEFLSADPVDPIDRPQIRGNSLHGCLEHAVAYGMSVCVIDVLEMIEVDAEDGELLVQALHTGKGIDDRLSRPVSSSWRARSAKTSSAS